MRCQLVTMRDRIAIAQGVLGSEKSICSILIAPFLRRRSLGARGWADRTNA